MFATLIVPYSCSNVSYSTRVGIGFLICRSSSFRLLIHPLTLAHSRDHIHPPRLTWRFPPASRPTSLHRPPEPRLPRRCPSSIPWHTRWWCMESTPRRRSCCSEPSLSWRRCLCSWLHGSRMSFASMCFRVDGTDYVIQPPGPPPPQDSMYAPPPKYDGPAQEKTANTQVQSGTYQPPAGPPPGHAPTSPSMPEAQPYRV
jgi:hypothetical protein